MGDAYSGRLGFLGWQAIATKGKSSKLHWPPGMPCKHWKLNRNVTLNDVTPMTGGGVEDYIPSIKRYSLDFVGIADVSPSFTLAVGTVTQFCIYDGDDTGGLALNFVTFVGTVIMWNSEIHVDGINEIIGRIESFENPTRRVDEQ